MARDAKDDRKRRLAQALRTNLRLRKQASGGAEQELLRREDRLAPRLKDAGRHGEGEASPENRLNRSADDTPEQGG